jgi:hypothetical protein
MRAGLANALVMVTTGAMAWPCSMKATAATISTLPPPAASVLITQLTKPAANSARSVRLGPMCHYHHGACPRALILIKTGGNGRSEDLGETP